MQGLGVNKPDVRRVVVWGWPSGIDELVQLWGRAGRDGLPATVVLVVSSLRRPPRPRPQPSEALERSAAWGAEWLHAAASVGKGGGDVQRVLALALGEREAVEAAAAGGLFGPASEEGEGEGAEEGLEAAAALVLEAVDAADRFERGGGGGERAAPSTACSRAIALLARCGARDGARHGWATTAGAAHLEGALAVRLRLASPSEAEAAARALVRLCGLHGLLERANAPLVEAAAEAAASLSRQRLAVQAAIERRRAEARGEPPPPARPATSTTPDVCPPSAFAGLTPRGRAVLTGAVQIPRAVAVGSFAPDLRTALAGGGRRRVEEVLREVARTEEEAAHDGGGAAADYEYAAIARGELESEHLR